MRIRDNRRRHYKITVTMEMTGCRSYLTQILFGTVCRYSGQLFGTVGRYLLTFLLTCLLTCMLVYLLTYLIAYLLTYLHVCLLTYLMSRFRIDFLNVSWESYNRTIVLHSIEVHKYQIET